MKSFIIFVIFTVVTLTKGDEIDDAARECLRRERGSDDDFDNFSKFLNREEMANWSMKCTIACILETSKLVRSDRSFDVGRFRYLLRSRENKYDTERFEECGKRFRYMGDRCERAYNFESCLGPVLREIGLIRFNRDRYN